jgi:hypothetical protein
MKRYKCHKIVEAAPVHYVGPDFITVSTGENSFERVNVPPDFFARGGPALDDYLVRYEDGYLSWSPKAVFEAGYTLITPEVKDGELA